MVNPLLKREAKKLNAVNVRDNFFFQAPRGSPGQWVVFS